MKTSFIIRGIATMAVSLLVLVSCKKESNEITVEGEPVETTGDTVITNAETEAVGHPVDSVNIEQHLDSINNLPQ